MKIITYLIIVLIVGCVIIAGCFTKPITDPEGKNSSSPITTPLKLDTTTSSVLTEKIGGELNVSIGDYSAIVPVFIDNKNAGEISKGKPLSLTVSEGHHTVKVCAGDVCKQIDVESKFRIKTTIDFGDLLKKEIPQGLLNVSIGDYNADLPVYIDDISVGVVSPGNPLVNLKVNGGRHAVKICEIEGCIIEFVEVNSTITNTIDFGESLKKGLIRGPLTVSIGAYDAELPVFIDNRSIGNVSQGKPLNLMLSVGRHTVHVCVGNICENEIVEVKFARQSSVDFGERLKRDVEFSKPTVRIVNSFQSGSQLLVDVEFINPDKIDHTMIASVQCVYSYISSVSKNRSSTFSQGQVTKLVKAGERITQRITLSLPGGSDPIALDPVIISVSIK